MKGGNKVELLGYYSTTVSKTSWGNLQKNLRSRSIERLMFPTGIGPHVGIKAQALTFWKRACAQLWDCLGWHDDDVEQGVW